MKVALMLKLKSGDERQELGQAVVFRVEGDRVVGVENETLPISKGQQLSFWALSRKINEIYLPEVTEEIRKIFTKIGVVIRGHEEMQESVLFRNYIV